ncbi:hypothetical protein AOL_s00117g38 [Orbilia oligospora ATCC 24927]|uniref:O-methyltransferase n=2 Tax=Orbilia oligospora TaxID=2813651 RepID=G1XLZ1_ARTOA|nr:hypothetical protein AOL_s00117g38 [Orbilia oligospora ATCC 24927]EGX45833.1 hypothetical protein AOL_s00117g38 [Orbilia oligospora ATCC 24927]KAF3284332.1 hypothetical protein TWF970_011551 [Orbilia oligospora]
MIGDLYPSTLFPNGQVEQAVDKYCEQQSLPVPSYITEHKLRSLEDLKDHDYMVPTLEIQFLMFLVGILDVETVLEIGCFTGYSALGFAEALKNKPNAKITTLEIDPKPILIARKAFKGQPEAQIIEILGGDATASLNLLHGQSRSFDLIFLDANKEGYADYFNKILDLQMLSPRGVLVVDNVLWRGLVADRTPANPQGNEISLAKAEVMDSFNKLVKADDRVEQLVLPLFDGLSLIRLKQG